MLRLLKFVPVILPIIAKFVRSPRGQKVIADLRRRIAKGGNSGPTSGR